MCCRIYAQEFDMSSLGISTSSALITQIMKKDADKTGTISKAEFQSWAAGKSGNSSSATKAMFGKIDADGNGSLTKTELSNFFSPPKLDMSALLQTSSSGSGSSLLDSLSSTNASTSNGNSTINKILQTYLDKLKSSTGSQLSTSA